MDEEKPIVVNGNVVNGDNDYLVQRANFRLFCRFVLEHTKYDEMIAEENRKKNGAQDTPSLFHLKDESFSSEQTSIENSTYDGSEMNSALESSMFQPGNGTVHEEGFNSVTCFCGKPFAGRPMIECSRCLTWLHMSCVKVKRKNIPEFYYCDRCKTTSSSSTDESPNETKPTATLLGSPGSNNINNNNNVTKSSNMLGSGNSHNGNSHMKPKKLNKSGIKKGSAIYQISPSNHMGGKGEMMGAGRKPSSVNGLRKLKKIRGKIGGKMTKMINNQSKKFLMQSKAGGSPPTVSSTAPRPHLPQHTVESNYENFEAANITNTITPPISLMPNTALMSKNLTNNNHLTNIFSSTTEVANNSPSTLLLNNNENNRRVKLL